MALLNRPLTEDEARNMLDNWREHQSEIVSFWHMMAEVMSEPRVHAVHYWRDGRVKYISPDTFWIGPQGNSVLHIREPRK